MLCYHFSQEAIPASLLQQHDQESSGRKEWAVQMNLGDQLSISKDITVKDHTKNEKQTTN